MKQFFDAIINVSVFRIFRFTVCWCTCIIQSWYVISNVQFLIITIQLLTINFANVHFRQMSKTVINWLHFSLILLLLMNARSWYYLAHHEARNNFDWQTTITTIFTPFVHQQVPNAMVTFRNHANLCRNRVWKILKSNPEVRNLYAEWMCPLTTTKVSLIMMWKILFLVLMTKFSKLTAALKINSIWTPDVIENGTQVSVKSTGVSN